MSLSSSVIPVVLLVGVVGSVAVAQPGVPVVRERRARQFTLRAEEPPVLLPLRVAAHEVTTLTFDAPIGPDSVDRAALAPFFSRVGVYADALVLKASVDLPSGTRPVLTVRFAGPDAPAQVGFVLTTVDAEVDSQVEVFRRGRSAQALGRELATLRAQCAFSGLGGAVLTGAVTDEGVTVSYLSEKTTRIGMKAEGPHTLYRAGSTRALATLLINPVDGAPWVPGFVRVTPHSSEGRALPAHESPLLMREKQLEPGARAVAVLEWQLPPETLPGTRFTLEVWDRSGERGVRWEQVAP